jgi:demethylmenaquinone methyltransferase/2-methoxy-6-polyprenyl-1,4-benzoquinol methylase
MTRAQLDKRPGEVAAMFDSLAGRYDLLNDVLSAGQVRLWRRTVARALRARAGERVLDLAAGTGTSSLTFAASGADCVACDFSVGMLQVGHRRAAAAAAAAAAVPAEADPAASGAGPGAGTGAGPGAAQSPGRVSFAAGDALRLPFRDGAFDAVTISFGLRNVADAGAALAEMRRVTRPGGRLVVCEFSHIRWPPLNMLYRRYLTQVLPAIARRVAHNSDAYEYLSESIMDWPAQRDLARVVQGAGWSGVKWRDLSFGVVALHLAVADTTYLAVADTKPVAVADTKPVAVADTKPVGVADTTARSG